MTIRTSEKIVTFKRPFVLSGFDQLLQAGAYRVETDEELVEGVSFPAYRRIATLLHLDVIPGQPGVTQTLTVDPDDLDAALKCDRTSPQARDDLPAEGPAAGQPQPSERAANGAPLPGAEPDIRQVILDPIIRMIMHSDGLSPASVWRVVEKARVQLAARAVRVTLKGATVAIG